MNFRLLFICFFILPACSETVSAQTETDPVVEQIIESIAENTVEDFDYSELLERLNYYRKNPLDLNRATASQLKELVFLSPLQINALLQHIHDNGAVAELPELQSITGFSPDVIRKLEPFITLNRQTGIPGISAGTLAKNGSHDLMMRYGQLLEKQRGYSIADTAGRSHYLGSPMRLFLRYRYNYKQRIAIALNMEKDAGEAFFSGAQSWGFDFYSGSIFLKDWGRVSKLVIGDYSLQTGQGLTLWSGLSFGKGAAIATVPRQDIGLRPYSSTNEALFFRGLAATVSYRNIDFTPFISYRKLDAGLTDEAVAGDQEITALNQAGLHRTPTEIKNKNAVSQLVYGITAQYTYKHLTVGITGMQSGFNHSFEPSGLPYRKYDFSGSKLSNTGLYYNYTWRNLYFFGEVAHSLNGGLAYLNGIIGSVASQVSLVLLHRNFQKDYHSLYNQAFSESARATNEKGFYTGLIINPVQKITWSSYADFFRFPWLKYRVDAPSSGYELFSQLNYDYSKKLRITLRYRFKLKEENDDLDNTMNYLQEVRRSNYRAECSYQLTKGLQLRSRAELVKYRRENYAAEPGYLACQDIIYNPLSKKVSGSVRLAFFNTDSFNSRIYAYENDVLYSYSVPAFQNSGWRTYANVRYTPKRGCDVWLRYALTRYTDINQVGSGLDRIEGNKRSDIKVQLRFQF